MNVTGIEKCSHAARENLQKSEKSPYLLCNWVNSAFIHYEVDAACLQPEIPYALDLYDNKAYVSLVAFTLEQFRFAQGGYLTLWITAPLATHKYFNVRTYVRHEKESGIYFIKEWISQRLSSIIASRLYGLPCHYGRLDYQHNYHEAQLSGRITPSNINGHYEYLLKANPKQELSCVMPGSLDEFLLERYSAFVKGHGEKQYFRIWHKPWLQVPLEKEILRDELLPQIGTWGHKLKFTKAHFSPGVYGVWMGRPQIVRSKHETKKS